MSIANYWGGIVWFHDIRYFLDVRKSTDLPSRVLPPVELTPQIQESGCFPSKLLIPSIRVSRCFSCPTSQAIILTISSSHLLFVLLIGMCLLAYFKNI